MNQSAVREDFIPPVDVDMSQGGVHAFCSEGMQIAQLPITPCFGSPSGMPVPSGVTKPSSNGLASGQDSGMVVRRFPSCDGDGLECSHEHEEYVEGGVKITKCTHTHVHSARQANQKAVQKYRQKKKLELENLKKEVSEWGREARRALGWRHCVLLPKTPLPLSRGRTLLVRIWDVVSDTRALLALLALFVVCSVESPAEGEGGRVRASHGKEARRGRPLDMPQEGGQGATGSHASFAEKHSYHDRTTRREVGEERGVEQQTVKALLHT